MTDTESLLSGSRVPERGGGPSPQSVCYVRSPVYFRILRRLSRRYTPGKGVGELSTPYPGACPSRNLARSPNVLAHASRSSVKAHNARCRRALVLSQHGSGAPKSSKVALSKIAMGGKGFGGGEATRDPSPTFVDPNDPNRYVTAFFHTSQTCYHRYTH